MLEVSSRDRRAICLGLIRLWNNNGNNYPNRKRNTPDNRNNNIGFRVLARPNTLFIRIGKRDFAREHQRVQGTILRCRCCILKSNRAGRFGSADEEQPGSTSYDFNGLVVRIPEKREKSRSVLASFAPHEADIAARCASMTRLPVAWPSISIDENSGQFFFSR